MFEFAAGQVHQEERERRIAEGLRRRELLESAMSNQGDNGSPSQQATIRRWSVAPRRTTSAARAHAER